MKLLAQLEKQKISWVLILLGIIFFFLRLPSFIEPYWYGDEGIYEVIGQSMDHGKLLYRDIWDNKPPLLYTIYAFTDGDQTAVKIISALVGIVTIIAFYFLSQKLFNKQKISIFLTTLLILFFATPFLEANIANAEDFILLPVILAGLIIYHYFSKSKPSTLYPKPLFIAGLLLGIAFLLKIVAIFDLAAFLMFIIILKLPERLTFFPNKKTHRNELGIMNNELWKKILVPDLLYIILGFLTPFIITILYFALNHAVTDFFQATFFGNVDYVGWENNLFGIPQGWLVLKLLLLAGGVGLILKNRNRLSKAEIFIFIWLLFSIFNVYFSGRPYTHYAIVLLPSFCLFLGLFFTAQSSIYKVRIVAAGLILIIVLNLQFHFNFTRPFLYYKNVMQFLNGQKSVEDYQTFFDPHVPRDYAVANFISTHTSASDTVFLWGNNPQIYAMSHKVPISRYTVAYHITQNSAFDETQLALNKKEPKYIIVLNESQPLPFVIPLYIMRYNISGATIYERSL